MKLKAGVLVVLGAATVAVAGQVGQKLFFNGATASMDVRVIGGKAYVPLADVAKAMDLTVQKRDGGFELIKSGGAGQVANKFVGKVGEEIFTGKWRFTVLSVDRAKTYDLLLSSAYKKHLEADSNEDLIIVSCRVKNGTPQKDELVFSPDWEGTHNALTDADEQSYQPFAFDVKESENAPVGVTFLPGAAINFKMIFKVPTGTKPKDLIFTALRYSVRAGFDQKKDPPQDIRVTLGG
jgi:hypothetical protein